MLDYFSIQLLALLGLIVQVFRVTRWPSDIRCNDSCNWPARYKFCGAEREREREREREEESEPDRPTDRERERETQTQAQTDCQRERGRAGERERERERKREKERERERERVRVRLRLRQRCPVHRNRSYTFGSCAKHLRQMSARCNVVACAEVPSFLHLTSK